MGRWEKTRRKNKKICVICEICGSLFLSCVYLVSVCGKNHFNENCITVGKWSELAMLGTKTLINRILSWV
jgi:hypothetical protein